MAPTKRRIVTSTSGTPRRSKQSRRERPPKASPLRMGVGLSILALLALGLYVARELIEPPPPPRLGGVSATQGQNVARDEAPVETLDRQVNAPGVAEPSGGTAAEVPPEPLSDPGPYPAGEPRSVSEPTAPPRGTILRSAPPGRREPNGPARLAIVIDDLGRSLDEVDSLAAIGVALTYAVLPFETRTPAVVARLSGMGAEILCHLPMEPRGALNPGPGALRATMSHDELTRATRRALAAVPGAIGVNNHMGSGLSAHRSAMTSVLGVVRQEGLYYLDSRTTADTVGYTVARELGLTTGERQVFLDSDRDPAAIRGQFQRLLDIAQARGGAIAIAHPYPETIAVLQDELPRLEGHGYEVVPASELLDPPG